MLFLKSVTALNRFFKHIVRLKRGDTPKQIVKQQQTTDNIMINTWRGFLDCFFTAFHIEANKLVATWKRAMEVRFLASARCWQLLIKMTSMAKLLEKSSELWQLMLGSPDFGKDSSQKMVIARFKMMRFLDPILCRSNCWCWNSYHQMQKRKTSALRSADKRFSRCEKFLQGPRNPNLRGGHGPKLVTD